MKSLLTFLLLCSAGLFAQQAIPPGTVLPVQLKSTLDSLKNKPGQTITARIMQDVPLSTPQQGEGWRLLETPPGPRIPAGAKVTGHIIDVAPSRGGIGAGITLRFDAVSFRGHTIPVTTNLRALASMMEVEDAQVPPIGTDRGTPWAWMNTIQIGGEAVYGQGGEVTHGSQVVGHYAPGGVLVRLSEKPGTTCRGAVEGNDRLQALWLFSSDACGLYGFRDLEIAHAGQTAPLGQITLASKSGRLHISAGSGLLLQVQ